VIRWDAPGPYDVAFTTRNGGVSEGPFESLNLGLLTDDDPDRARENRRRACEALGADPDALALNRQVHATTVNRAVAGSRGVEGDALWTDEPGVPIAVLTADCLPIALARTNGDGPALAVVHAGWRGLLGGVIQNAVAELGGSPAAIIGPAIGPCCYEVGDEVAEPYRARFGGEVIHGRDLDLWRAAELALIEAGCEQVERMDLCTSCHEDRFFSHRRDHGRTGRQGVIALIRPGSTGG
jgi:polyphenol oxidase